MELGESHADRHIVGGHGEAVPLDGVQSDGVAVHFARQIVVQHIAFVRVAQQLHLVARLVGLLFIHDLQRAVLDVGICVHADVEVREEGHALRGREGVGGIHAHKGGAAHIIPAQEVVAVLGRGRQRDLAGGLVLGNARRAGGVVGVGEHGHRDGGALLKLDADRQVALPHREGIVVARDGTARRDAGNDRAVAVGRVHGQRHGVVLVIGTGA